jgi:hypothetical protein
VEKLTQRLRVLAALLLAAKAGVDLGLSLRRAANPDLDRPRCAVEDDPAADQPQDHPGLHIPEHLLVNRTPAARPRRRVDRGAFGVQDVAETAEPGGER